jgi:3-phosphoshikimate 1-carboxyvinyltransferase
LILDDLEAHAETHPDGRAAIEVGAGGQTREMTWAQLLRASAHAAAALMELGVTPGEPVAFQLPNRLEFLAIALGTLRIGAVCEPLMPIFREHELEFMLRASAARALFVPDSFRGRDHATMARDLAPRLPALEHVVVMGEEYGRLLDNARPDPAQLNARRPAGAAAAQLLFTSGSTGEPKGVLHRHEVLDRAADAHIAHFGLTTDDVIYIPSPLAHQTGFLYGMWIALGATQVMQEVWDAERGFDAMQRWGVTFVQCATPFLADLVRVAGERSQAPAALRTFVATGAAIPRELAREARTALQAEVGGAWGTTESCLGAAFTPGGPPERAWCSDGGPMPNVRLRIVDDDGRRLPPATEGNFEVLTDCLFDGYLNRPDLTAEAVTPDGWYRSGDLATLDAEGQLRITGRVKDVINRGGEKVPVAEIEQLLYAHPAVADVAIVAMPDERLGERACAFVVLADDTELDFAAMQAHLDAHRVTKTYWPERLLVVPELPRTPSGKIQKFILRDQARGVAERKAIAR